MKKYIIIIFIVFGVYKLFISSEGFAKSPYEITSAEYKFQAFFSSKPHKKTKVLNLPEIGKLKVTTYGFRDNKLSCAVSISGYLESNKPLGQVEDQIEPVKRGMLKGFGGEITNTDYFFSYGVKGYELNLLAKDKKLVKTRMFLYEDTSYGLTCHYQNSAPYNALVDEFMQTFNLT